MKKSPVYLIDSSIFIFRHYFALPNNWYSAEGYPTHAVYGFCTFLLRLMEQERPHYLAAAFDESLGTGFRHRLDPDYKANREMPDAEFEFQLNHCREAARLLGIPDFASTEYEADDLIGSLAVIARVAGHSVNILSRDKDLAQLLRAGDYLWDFGSSEPRSLDVCQLKLGVAVERLPDYLALVGDSIDNIPGVPGIGAKTAAAIFQQFDNLDAVFGNLDQLALLPVRGAKKLAEKLGDHRDQVERALQLTRICCDALPTVNRDDLPWRGVDHDGFREFCLQLGLGTGLAERARRL